MIQSTVTALDYMTSFKADSIDVTDVARELACCADDYENQKIQGQLHRLQIREQPRWQIRAPIRIQSVTRFITRVTQLIMRPNALVVYSGIIVQRIRRFIINGVIWCIRSALDYLTQQQSEQQNEECEQQEEDFNIMLHHPLNQEYKIKETSYVAAKKHKSIVT